MTDFRNLLDVMRVTRAFSITLFACCLTGMAWSQSPAALEKLLAHRSVEEVANMEEHAHYRYVGELLFYSRSFLIEENGVERAATEAEIAAIDLHAYDAVRLPAERTGVHDPVLDKHVILLSRNEFEQGVLDLLNEADREAYLTNKDRSRSSSKTR